MSSLEFAEWMAYETFEPGEPYRGDAQTALICQTIVTILRRALGAKGPDPELKDFLLRFEPKTLTRIPYEQLKAKFKGWLHSALAEQENRKAKDGKHRKHSGDPKPPHP